MKSLLLPLLLVPMLAFGQDTLHANAEQRKFCLGFVKSWIEHDCDAVYESYADSLYVYFDIYAVIDTFLTKKSIKTALDTIFCQEISKDYNYSYQEYLVNYDLRFYEVKAIADSFPYGSGNEKIDLRKFKYYKIREGDIFFRGDRQTKPNNSIGFEANFKFIFRKINGVYKIIVLTP